MLNVREAIEMRRSVRHFRPDEVPDKLIEQMLEGARLAPSGSNIQPWRFLVVKEASPYMLGTAVCGRSPGSNRLLL